MKDNNFSLKGYYWSRNCLNPAYKNLQQECFSSQNQQSLLDEPFYHIYITPFSITISVTTVIKAKNIGHITPSIIQKTRQLNTQSSGLKLVKLSYLVGRGWSKKHIFPHDLLVTNISNTADPELFIFTNHAAKHKQINTVVYHEILQKQNTRNISREILRFSRLLFPPLTLRYNSLTRFPEFPASVTS